LFNFDLGIYKNLVIGTSHQGNSTRTKFSPGAIFLAFATSSSSEVMQAGPVTQRGIQQHQQLENGGHCDRSFVVVSRGICNKGDRR